VAGHTLLIFPALDGRPTGGTRFDARLVAELGELGVAFELADRASASARSRDVRLRSIWVDSLFLDLVPELARVKPPGVPLGIVLHYLPSLVELGERLERRELTALELLALQRADRLIVTSSFMGELVARLGVRSCPIAAIPPGTDEPPCADELRVSPALGVRAALVAHVVPGKGIEPFLRELAPKLCSTDNLEIHVLGDLLADPRSGRSCVEFVSATPALAARVRFRGLLDAAEVQAELQKCNLMLSTSQMESYGMALAEGRRAGLPVLALDGGNVREHVTAAAGGELTSDASALADALLRVVRDASEHARRLRAARDTIPQVRAWRTVAEEFVRFDASSQ
jgi:glycosyltransferase involved in cell wall biosynthesis